MTPVVQDVSNIVLEYNSYTSQYQLLANKENTCYSIWVVFFFLYMTLSNSLNEAPIAVDSRLENLRKNPKMQESVLSSFRWLFDTPSIVAMIQEKIEAITNPQKQILLKSALENIQRIRSGINWLTSSTRVQLMSLMMDIKNNTTMSS
jgi:hypothetical protein